MKLLLISTSYPLTDNGSEAAGSFVKDFVDTMKEQGHEVAVVAPTTNEVLHVARDSTDHYYWFLVPKLPLSLLSPKKPQDWFSILDTLRKGRKIVDQAVHEFKPDHIFGLWALPSGYWARYAKKHHGIPYSIWALGSDIWSLGKVPLVKSYLKTVLQDAQRCFADGFKLAEDVSNISHKNCDFLPSTRQLPVCGLPLTPPRSTYRLCFLGRWHPNKGIDLLLEALHLLKEDDWRKIEAVRIAGGGDMAELIEQQVSSLQEKSRPVLLSGFQDKHGAAELLTWTDYVVIPSRIESIPVIFSDALQANRPVITTPVGDLPRLIELFDCGVLTKGINASDIAEAISNELSKPDSNYGQYIANAKNEFELKAIAQKFSDSTL